MKKCVLSLASTYENPIWQTNPKLDTKSECGAIYGELLKVSYIVSLILWRV
jgi:hypothetical protein